jgi:large subunit ribosomal protein L31
MAKKITKSVKDTKKQPIKPQTEKEKKPITKITKPTLHPVSVKCTCGNEFKTLSTAKDDLKVEICSKCHPLYTGTQKLIDTAGQVEKYKERLAKMEALKKKKPRKK